MLTQKDLPKWHCNLHIRNNTKTNQAEPFFSTTAYTQKTDIQSISNEKQSEATM